MFDSNVLKIEVYLNTLRNNTDSKCRLVSQEHYDKLLYLLR